MKKLILAFFALAMSVCAFAQTEKGFRMLGDVHYTISVTEAQILDGWSEKISNRVGASITAGYQLNELLFLGGGLQYSNWHEGSANTITPYAVGRVDYPFSEKFGAFVDLRAGYTLLSDVDGFYCVPSLGIRYGLTENIGLNLGIGYEMQKVKDCDGVAGGVAIKLGIDF